MIILQNGFPQSPNGLIVPNGSIRFQLNTDATIIAAPYGFVFAANPVTFQFNSAGQIQPNTGAFAQIWSNQELNPQNTFGLGTYYLVTFYDQNGALLNTTPLWWQFPETIGTTVDISNMTAIATIGGNIIFYPTNFLGGTGTVTSVAFVGDGTILSATPSTAVTTAGNISATLLTQSANLVLAGPTTGIAALPTFRAITLADLPAGINIWNDLGAPTGNLVLATTTFNTTFTSTTPTIWAWANITAATSGANQNSPVISFAGTYWTGATSASDAYSFQNIIPPGINPATIFILAHTGSGVGNFTFNGQVNFGSINSAANITASTNIRVSPTTGIATNIANVNSSVLSISGAYWTGSVSAADTWTFNDILGTGTNPTSTLTITQTGSSGVALVQVNSSINIPTGSTYQINGVPLSTSSAFSSLTGGTNSAASMIVGTGASLGISGSGTITATGLTGTPAITVGAITNTAITASGLITGKANIQLGVSGTTSGVITLEGSTSGASTITGPAVAGTITNPIAFSNAISIAETLMFNNTSGTLGQIVFVPSGGTYFDYLNTLSFRSITDGLASLLVLGTTAAAAVTVAGTTTSSTVVLTAATPTSTTGQVGLGTTAGFGNGTPATPMTTTTKSTGTGPTTPQTIVNYLEIDIAGTKYWIPLVQ
jgi:hypothetical protein